MDQGFLLYNGHCALLYTVLLLWMCNEWDVRNGRHIPFTNL